MNRVIGNCEVKKKTDLGICITKLGKEAWLPLSYVEYNEEDKCLTYPDWLTIKWQEPKKKERKVNLTERLEKALKKLKEYKPAIELTIRKGRYVVLINGRKKHWGNLSKKEALTVITTLLALVKP